MKKIISTKKVAFALLFSFISVLNIQISQAEPVYCPEPTEIKEAERDGSVYQYYGETTGAMKIKLTHDVRNERIHWYMSKIKPKTNVPGFEGRLVCTYILPGSGVGGTSEEYNPSLYSEPTYSDCKVSADGTHFDCPKKDVGQK